MTQAWTSGILAQVGDVFTQKLEDRIRNDKEKEGIEEKLKAAAGEEAEGLVRRRGEIERGSVWSEPVDWRRNASVTTFGLWYGWWGHYWYKWLDVFAHKMAKEGSAKFVMTKVLSEQVFWNPATLILYFASVSIMEGKGTDYIKKKMHEDFAPTLAIELLTWPALTAVIFKYSPVRYQLIWINVMELFYDAFLSWVQHNGYHLPGAKPHH
uniref:Uncharacterized protein n=1 Tax=Arcella intermedia TaxID=1963864 RepID=A0A6B2LHA1_9EUKA